jgi:hypothetical protein
MVYTGHLPAMSAFVELELPGGKHCTVGPGAIIGRSFAADVHLDDGRVSEAHALLSLRGGEFVLFALRGRVRVDGRDVPRVALERGLRLELARGVELVVADLELPSELLALEGPGVPRQVLTGVLSICAAPRLHVVAGVRAEAAALVFSDGLAWFVREGDAPARRVASGDPLQVGPDELRFISQARVAVGTPETGPASLLGGLRLVSKGHSVQLWPPGVSSPCVISGQPAALLARLLEHGGPLRWESAAAALWPDERPDEVVRHRLDVVLGKLRRRLEDAHVRRDLVTAHRNGFLELMLYPGDQAHDRQA